MRRPATLVLAYAAALALLAGTTAGARATPEAEAASAPGAARVVGYPAAVPPDADPKVAAWQKLQFGMFVHWGVYSAYGGYYKGEQQPIGYPEQIKAWMDIPTSDYLATAGQFSAEQFDADEWCATAKAAGAKYLVLTSKHHDGFAMWDTDTTDYKVTEATAFGRDPVKELSKACRAQGLGFGLYFSIIDWTLQEPDPWTNTNPIPESMMPFIQSQLGELLTRYGDLDEIWFDMGAPTPEQSAAMAGTVRRLQPDAMVNSRVWNDKGDFEVGGDNAVPDQQLQGPWQSAVSVFPRCWGYCTWPSIDRSDGAVAGQVRTQVRQLFGVAAGGGNYLLNVGPRGDGAIDPFETTVFKGIGAWQEQHPDALQGARPTRYGRQSWGDTTTKGDALYLGVWNWPDGGGDIRLPGVGNAIDAVTVDGTSTSLPHRKDGDDLVITLPADPTGSALPVIKVETDGTPRIVPDTAVRSTDRHFSLDAGALTPTLSPKGGGPAGAVRQTGWISGLDGNRGMNDAQVRIDGDFAADVDYRVTLGDSSVTVSGARLNQGAISGLRYRSQQVTPISVELARPAYFADPLGVTITGIGITGQPTER